MHSVVWDIGRGKESPIFFVELCLGQNSVEFRKRKRLMELVSSSPETLGSLKVSLSAVSSGPGVIIMILLLIFIYLLLFPIY